ncbi:hypothetical protein GCM10009665_03740 [Kitasatospora nipponensis]|uniref:Neocarzinostatin family protein n=1 Tax=Kitasatospora nipponensis TaxID=258049 RepID=A0ABN1VMF0_9ACTN
MNEFRSLLSEELSATDPPPLGNLVGVATLHGRRARRARTVKAIGAVAGSAFALTAAAVLLGGLATGATKPVPLGAAAGAASDPASGAASADPGDALVDTTPAALLKAVLNALPGDLPTDSNAGNSANPATHEGLGVQTYVRTPQGTGMLRVFVTAGSKAAMACDADSARGSVKTRCSVDGFGQKVQVTTGLNCTQSTSVLVQHTDGATVQVNLGTCLAYQNGGNATGVLALTEEQAIALAGNQAIDVQMPTSFVSAANAYFGTLPKFS